MCLSSLLSIWTPGYKQWSDLSGLQAVWYKYLCCLHMWPHNQVKNRWWHWSSSHHVSLVLLKLMIVHWVWKHLFVIFDTWQCWVFPTCISNCSPLFLRLCVLGSCTKVCCNLVDLLVYLASIYVIVISFSHSFWCSFDQIFTFILHS